MSPLFKKIYQPQVLLIIIFIQTLGLVRLINSSVVDYYRNSPQVLAESLNDPDQEYRACLAKPVAEREACAREIGQNLANNASLANSEKVSNCMKLRPIFVRFCLEELRKPK